MKDFNIFKKKCYLFVWSAKKVQKQKTQKLQEKNKGRKMPSWNCVAWNIKKFRFIKEQEASALLLKSVLGIKPPHLY